MKTNWKILPWVPAAFCAFLCFISLASALAGGFWKPPFFSFLPMCFFFVGTAMMQMRREILELRQKLDALEKERV